MVVSGNPPANQGLPGEVENKVSSSETDKAPSWSCVRARFIEEAVRVAVTSGQNLHGRACYLIERLENVGKELVPARTEFGRAVARDVKAVPAASVIMVHQHGRRLGTSNPRTTHRG